MSHRVGIIGMGWVGTSVAISTLVAGVADELLVNDLDAAIAEGEAMDLMHGDAFYPRCTVRVASVAEMHAADVIVVAAGRGGAVGESRLDLLQENLQVMTAIGRQLKGFAGIVLVVSNPVDAMTQVMTKVSGLPAARVLGTGASLDTARLHQQLGGLLQLSDRSIHAHVVGEHGDSQVVLWSCARIGSVPLRQWPGWTSAQEESVATAVRTAAAEVIRRKGCTNHAIGLVTADLLRSVLRGERRVHSISRVQDGAYGLHHVALSLPTVLGREGGVQVLEPPLSGAEHAALMASAALLRTTLAAAWKT
jgi:L-lactate dehydrogenase